MKGIKKLTKELEQLNTFNLPKINETVKDDEKYRRTKYLVWYLRIVKKFKDNPIDNDNTKEVIVSEVHHILPRSLGGDHSKNNLIRLPVRYHIMAHLLLKEAYPEDHRIISAAYYMLSMGNSKKDFEEKVGIFHSRKKAVQKHFSTRTVSRYREDYIKLKQSDEWKQEHSGEKSWNFGRHRSEETKQKLREANLGKKQSLEVRQRMSESRKGPNNYMYGRHLSEETKRKLSEANKGRKRDPDAVKRSADGIRGEKNWLYGKHLPEETCTKISNTVKQQWIDNPEIFGKARTKVVSPDGKIYNSVKEAALDYGLKPSTLGSKLSRNKNSEGWRYLTQGRKAKKRGKYNINKDKGKSD